MVDYDGVSRTFNEANQMTNDGTNTLTYDNNGNLLTVGSDTYTWDRANRLSSVGNHSYVYDGLSNRVQQTVSSVVTDYLNDVQPGLTKLLKQDDGANVDRFVHGVRGIHAVDDGTDWNFYAQDGLGSVRAVVDDAGSVQSSMGYDSYGNVLGGSSPTDFGFTGEQTDANGSVFLRARYYDPSMGTFIKRDPAETPNRYGYVSGNPINLVDPSGLMSVGYGRASSGNSINGVRTNINWNPIYWNLENLFVVQSMNSGLCSESITTGNKRRYRHGGGDIQQDASNSGFNELIQQITNSYPVSNVTRGLDVNAQQITDSPIESLHGNVVQNLLIALNAMDSKLMTINKSLGEIFDQQELTIALDYVGLNGEFSGITPYGIPNLQRLGNNMIPSHIVHEWGHAIDRKDNFRHSDELASQTVKSFADIPSQANISIFNTVSNVQITGANTGCSPVPLTQEIEYPFGVSRQRIISGTPPNSGAYQRCLVGYGDIANNGIDAREDWADMFMNWVFDGRSDGGNAGFSRVSNLANVSKTSELYTLASFAQARRRWMENYTSTAF